jgi:hypothetical protein
MSSDIAPAVSEITPRDKILSMESIILEMPQCEFEVTHHFAPGLYAREVFIPKGSIVVGKIHKHAHLNCVSKGHIAVYTEEGLKEITAPATFMSAPGTKRVGYAIADTVWTTYHPTDETDVAKIELEVIAPSYEALGLDPIKEIECPG